MTQETPPSPRPPMPEPAATDGTPRWRVSQQRRLNVLLACYCLIFVVSAIGGPLRIEPPIPIRPEFLGNLMLVVGGGAAALWLWLVGGRRGGLAALLIGTLAWLIEGVGQATGLLFGSYRYTPALTPVLPGGVPLAIVGAWLLVVVGALGTAAWLRPTAGRDWLIGASGLLILALDLQIETVATFIQGFWVWQESGPYYGVPTPNFVAWLTTGLLLSALTVGLLGEHGRWRSTLDPPLLLFTLIALLFTLMNLAYGYLIPVAVGLVLLGLLLVRAVSPRG